jgi:hypothetical protein
MNVKNNEVYKIDVFHRTGKYSFLFFLPNAIFYMKLISHLASSE